MKSIKRNMQRVAKHLRNYVEVKGKTVETDAVVAFIQMLARLDMALGTATFSTSLLRELTMTAVSLTYPKLEYSSNSSVIHLPPLTGRIRDIFVFLLVICHKENMHKLSSSQLPSSIHRQTCTQPSRPGPGNSQVSISSLQVQVSRDAVRHIMNRLCC